MDHLKEVYEENLEKVLEDFSEIDISADLEGDECRN